MSTENIEQRCFYCEAKLTKDEVGLNKKLVGRSVIKMQCFSCLAAYFETTVEELHEKIEEFKRQGCALFG